MSDRRFYLPSYVKNPDREVLIEDIGNLLKISGLVFQGMGSTIVLLTPSGEPFELEQNIKVAKPTLEQWGEIIRRSDDPEVFVGEAGGINKVLHRKLRYEISGTTQQRIWARDDFRCMYCKRKMGEVQLTIDHFISLESGGSNEESNYLSACRQCNKRKGNIDPKVFCEQFGPLRYASLVKYLKVEADLAKE